MVDYKEMYFQLFNETTDIIERLKEAQCKMEDKFTQVDEPEKDRTVIGNR